MKLKCGRNEIELNENDVIMYNGHCYQIITRKLGHGWDAHSPLIAKARAKKLIKDGLLKEHKMEFKQFTSENLVYYTI